MATKRASRNYTDADKAKALALLAKHGGNVKQTALELGIPRQTLTDWAGGVNIKPVAIAQAEEEKKTLAEKCDELADVGIDLVIKKLRADGKTMEAERVLDIMERAVKTSRLLKGEPTTISEQGTPSEYSQKREALRAVRAEREAKRLAKVS